MVPRRHVVALAVASLLPAGCLAGGEGSPGSPQSPAGTGGTKTPTERRSKGSVSPSRTPVATTEFAISDADAGERAQQAEEKYVVGKLSDADCLKDWSTYGPTAEDEATVRERRHDGVVVDVRESFSYWTAEDEVDAVVEATYLVTGSGANRLNGDDVDPC